MADDKIIKLELTEEDCRLITASLTLSGRYDARYDVVGQKMIIQVFNHFMSDDNEASTSTLSSSS